MPKIVIENWSLGLWTAGPAAKNPKGTVTRATNVQFLDEGTVATRNGCIKVFDLASSTDGTLISGTHFFKAGTTVYDDTATSLGFTQAGDRLRVAAMSATGLLNDIVFFPTCMKKVYQGVVSNWGISDTPTAPTAVDSGVAGNLTGDYTYIITFYNSTTPTSLPKDTPSSVELSQVL